MMVETVHSPDSALPGQPSPDEDNPRGLIPDLGVDQMPPLEEISPVTPVGDMSPVTPVAESTDGEADSGWRRDDAEEAWQSRDDDVSAAEFEGSSWLFANDVERDRGLHRICAGKQ